MGRAISGGFVYRGAKLPALQGKYVFADLVDGRVMFAEESRMVRGGPRAPIEVLRIYDGTGRETTMAALVGDARVDLRIGADAAGELYLVTKADGRIWRISATRSVTP